RVGPRVSGLVAASCFSSGLFLTALGASFKALPLLIFGYGVIGGIGLGLGYITPVSTLIKWFPDRRGMATGIAIMGFGGGAIIAAPWSTSMLDSFGVNYDASGKVLSVADGAIGEAFLVHGLVYA